MSGHTKGMLLVFFGVLCMSVESPLIKLSNLTSFTFAFYYGSLIFISTSIILLSKGKSYYINAFKKEYIGVILAGICVGGSNIFFISAVKHASIANVFIILSTTPIWSAIFSKIIFNQPTPRRVYLTAIVLVFGISIMLYNDIGSSNMTGNLLAFCCVLFFSCIFVIVNRYKYANRFAYICLGGGVIALFSLIFGANLNETISTTSLFVLLGLGLVVTPISRYLMGVGARHIFPAEAGLLVVTESILAPIWAFFILYEVPDIYTIVGGVIILCAIISNSILSLPAAKFRKKVV